MTHIGPNCCCDPPCTPPVVSCTRTGNTFEWSVSGAQEASVTRICANGLTYTELTLLEGDGLTGGAAMGSLTDVSPICKYCVTASNECGTVFCCNCPPGGCRTYRLDLVFEEVETAGTLDGCNCTPLTQTIIFGCGGATAGRGCGTNVLDPYGGVTITVTCSSVDETVMIDDDCTIDVSCPSTSVNIVEQGDNGPGNWKNYCRLASYTLTELD
jgi:hypothetical protein